MLYLQLLHDDVASHIAGAQQVHLQPAQSAEKRGRYWGSTLRSWCLFSMVVLHKVLDISQHLQRQE